jgi:hypothetical protein
MMTNKEIEITSKITIRLVSTLVGEVLLLIAMGITDIYFVPKMNIFTSNAICTTFSIVAIVIVISTIIHIILDIKKINKKYKGNKK